MTHGSTEIGPIGATGFAATHFFGVAHISNWFFGKVGTTGSRGQALQFSTAGEKSGNQHKGGESNKATGDTNSFRSSQFFWRLWFRHFSPSLKARRFNSMLSKRKSVNKREREEGRVSFILQLMTCTYSVVLE